MQLGPLVRSRQKTTKSMVISVLFRSPKGGKVTDLCSGNTRMLHKLVMSNRKENSVQTMEGKQGCNFQLESDIMTMSYILVSSFDEIRWKYIYRGPFRDMNTLF